MTGQRLKLKNNYVLQSGDIIFVAEKIEYNDEWFLFKEYLTSISQIAVLFLLYPVHLYKVTLTQLFYMKLTPHEQKILKIINDNPKVVDNPNIRSKIAKKYQLTEKTLRNRIAELRKRGLLEKKSKCSIR